MQQGNREPLVGMHSGAISQNDILRVIQSGETFVYAMLTRQGALKIGVSKNLAQRKTSIGFGGFERYLAFHPGDYAVEQTIHLAMSADIRIGTHREYYYPVWDLVLPTVNQMREVMGVKALNRRDLPRPGFWSRRLPHPGRPVAWPLPPYWVYGDDVAS